MKQLEINFQENVLLNLKPYEVEWRNGLVKDLMQTPPNKSQLLFNSMEVLILPTLMKMQSTDSLCVILSMPSSPERYLILEKWQQYLANPSNQKILASLLNLLGKRVIFLRMDDS